MLVVLDACILIRDYWLKSTPFQVLFSAHDAIEGFEIWVPEVAFDETVNKFRTVVAEQYKVEIDATKKLARLINKERVPHPEPAESVLPEFGTVVLRERLRAAGCRFAPYPVADHKHVVQRQLAGKAPFSPKGTGYRDYLIWLTTLSLAESATEQNPAVLVTANTRDFFEGGALHPDLKADLGDRVVHVVDSVAGFNTSYLMPRLETVKGIAEKLENGNLNSQLEFYLEDGLEYAPDDIKLDVVAGFLNEQGRVRFARPPKIRDVRVSQTVRLTDGDVWAELQCSGSVVLETTTQAVDFATAHPTIRMFSTGTEPGEYSWEETYDFTARGSLIFDTTRGVIRDAGYNTFEINGATFKLGSGILGPW